MTFKIYYGMANNCFVFFMVSKKIIAQFLFFLNKNQQKELSCGTIFVIFFRIKKREEKT